MIRKILSIFILSGFLSITFVKADEGMWLLDLLNKNYNDMKKAGFKLSPEDIYSVNKACLKDAIIQFGNGCTGSVISSEGLVLTNHHCGYGYIQANSTLDHNYLEEGFWAMTKKQELPNENLTAKFLIRIEDVTSKVLAGVNDNMTELERKQKIYEASTNVETEATKGTDYTARVTSLFEGNNYYLFVYLIYKDVRLVGAPPSSIGKFGGDTDNWMWPRHTGDFSLFRIYTDAEGKPAEYTPENIPMKAKNFLQISLNEINKDDFMMILGYPGSTNRFLPSAGVKQAIDFINPAIVKIRDAKLTILRETMSQSREMKIKYSAKYARTSNYWKYFIGQTKGLLRLDIYNQKKKQEEEFQKWAETGDRQAKYGSVIKDFNETYQAIEQYNLATWYFREAALRGPDGISLAHNILKLHGLLVKADTMKNVTNEFKSKIMASITEYRRAMDEYFRDFDLPTEKKLMATLLKMYYDDVKKEFHPEIFAKIEKDFKGDFNKYAEAVYKKSIFASEDKMNEWLGTTKLKKLQKDPLFILMQDLFANNAKHVQAFNAYFDKLDKANRLFVDGMVKMHPEKLYYPNANSTIRLTYGQVKAYTPRDAVEYSYYTTLSGLIQKEDENDFNFEVPVKLKELYKNKDFGRYASKDGEMHVCYLSNNDITGGNSGSPVLNGNGELVGLAFDGNWEAMSGDIAYEPDLQRTIISDIRYVLFIIDKYAGAQNLIKELQLK